ncbi:hypothetical protein BDF19DRAFT_467374 [Syncephalis fuscata]|nr:hypothetical protein BDF19DRAFT_467374 [Syncephalis fuscata]
MVSWITLFTIGILLLGVIDNVAGHMKLYSPIPRGDPRNKGYGVSSTRLDAPLNGRKNPGKFPCRYQRKNFTVEFMQGSPHFGGHCQFAMSYDNGKTWVVLRTIMSMCFEGKAPYRYSIALPKGARNGRVLFGWTFINAGGNLEYYMNCADAEISGGRDDGSLRGPELLVARLRGTVNIDRWANTDGANDGKEHFIARKIVTIPVDAKPTDDGTVIGEAGDGKPGVEQPPKIIPWHRFFDSKFLSYETNRKLDKNLGDTGGKKVFFIATSDNPRGDDGIQASA